MAFQMIPPRVSSSPPPLDSLPSVACTGDDDDDDEFGTFATHNTFDITGLSDKLPPTPESSPSKFPPKEGGSQVLVNNLKPASNQVEPKDDAKGGDVIEVEVETSSSIPPPFDDENPKEFSANSVISDVNGECTASLEIGDDDDEFGDFSFCASDKAAGEARELGHSDGTELGGKSSSQKCSLASRNPDVSSPSNSDRSFSMIATPPPLDHVVDNVVVDDEFSRISPNPPTAPVVVCDDDFGDFESCAFDTPKAASSLAMGVTDEACVTSHSNGVKVDECFVTECEFGASERSDGANIDRQTGEGVSKFSRDFGDVGSSEVRKPSLLHEKSQKDLKLSEKIDGFSVVTDRTKHSENVNSSTSDIDDDSLPNRDTRNKAHSDGRATKDTDVSNSHSFECGRSLDTEVEDSVVRRGFPRSSNPESLVAQNLGNASSEPHYHSSSSSVEAVVSKEGFHHEVSACSISSSQSSGCSSVINVDRTEESTSIVNRKSNGVLQEDVDNAKELPVDYIKDGDVDGESDLDFGEFNKADDDDDDLDFGDLRDQVCGTFGVGESEDNVDDFGDFYEYDAARMVAPPVPCEEEDHEFGDFGVATAKSEDGADDDFGDFTKVEYEDDFGNFASPKRPECDDDGVPPKSTYEHDEFGDFTSQQGAEKQSESFRVSWHDNLSLPTSTDTPVLRKLESLILKWIPRESLTTSLSLENHRENHTVPTLFQSVEDDAFVWRQLENLESSAALTLSWGSTQAQTLYLSSVNVDARNIEQIPPAKFDWTSSGLTNPLEGPGLEREFLSEGEEKGAISRLKGPPAPSPLVQQILSSGKNSSTPSAATPLQSLSSDIREVVEHIPDIGFMRSRVLMFPIRGDE